MVTAVDSASFIEKRKFIVKLGKMLHKFGTPAYRLEAHLLNVAGFLGIGAAFAITPTVLTFVIWVPGEETEYTSFWHLNHFSMSLLSFMRFASYNSYQFNPKRC